MALTLLLLAAPHPGTTATIDVSAATLWRAPGLARAIDAPALANPVDLDRWNRNLATTASRAWLDSRVVTQALYGEKVTVLALRGRWAKVAVADQPTPLDRRGYPGWLPIRQLAGPFPATGPKRVVRSPTAVLHLPGSTIRLSYGTRLPVTGTNGRGNWLVRTPDGPGWIARDVLRKPSAPTGASIVAAAKRFLGLRYLWGGVSAWGFDCSGLVWDVFRAQGVTVPRDTGPQSRSGRSVVARNLRPGDLVFYGSPATHVAIAAGHGLMIESPDSAHGVRLVPLRPGFTSARRYTSG
ncbi:MAG TPA: C40 family peptidase [Gaiellaceae bacterium]|nr:C40 family peptidase [Gaiellaceae bacterium]